MYIHIGNEKIIKSEDILFILDYQGLKNNKIFMNFIDKIEENNMIDNKMENPKSVIIIKKNKKIIAYLSNISSLTLSKRNRI